MHEAPFVDLPMDHRDRFKMALLARDAGRIGADIPVWTFLQWLVGQGYLLHGSQQAGLGLLQPSGKSYGQPDDFSNRAGVYAASDALWAMMYALRGPTAKGQMDMCLRFKAPEGWSSPCYYYALGTTAGRDCPPKDLLAPGWVYVLDREGFEPSPPYDHPQFGTVQELHWIFPASVIPVMRVAVAPQDFPLPVEFYDVAEIRARSASEPWGFPWRAD
jgi:hypothetical protein